MCGRVIHPFRPMVVVAAVVLAGCGETNESPVLGKKGTPSPGGSQASAWTTHSPSGGRFSVQMPASPEVSTQPGSVFTTHIATCEQKNTRYFVTYFDPPPGSIAPDVAEGTMKRDRDASIKDVNGTLTSEKRVTIKAGGKEWPGLESVIEDGQFAYAGRLYAVDGRMYTLQVIYPKSEDHAADIAKFYDSFQVTNGPAAK